jgi:hypothetical protein
VRPEDTVMVDADGGRRLAANGVRRRGAPCKTQRSRRRAQSEPGITRAQREWASRFPHMMYNSLSLLRPTRYECRGRRKPRPYERETYVRECAGETLPD